jgi:hypothetical protein
MKILSELGERKDFDGLTALKLSRNIDNLVPEHTKFEKVKNDLIIKYGEKKKEMFEGKEQEVTRVTDANIDEYTKQINEMVAQEIEVDILLLDPSKISGVSPRDLLPLEWMFAITE